MDCVRESSWDYLRGILGASTIALFAMPTLSYSKQFDLESNSEVRTLNSKA